VYGFQKFRQYLLGRNSKFKLYTDHKPLLTIFPLQKGIPEIAAGRLQRWAITLSAYDYKVQLKPSTNHGNADALSRLPFDPDPDWVSEVEEIVCTVETNKLDELPVTDKGIRKATAQDSGFLIIHYMVGLCILVL